MDNKLLKEIKDYCKINDIDDIDGLINKMLKVGFDIERYGPNMSINIPKVVKEKAVKEEKITKEKVVKVVKEAKDNVNEDLYGE